MDRVEGGGGRPAATRQGRLLTQAARPRAGRTALLRWFEPRRHAYPWRGSRDPYAVWISEVMLQQTQAARVAVAYPRFLRRFPTVGSLARASRATVLRAWGDLGYNRRAVALSDAARVVVREHGGRFPRETDALDRLPGVGPYTAAAVASLAFGEPVAAVDTNVRRVVARVHLGIEHHDATPAVVATLAALLGGPARPGLVEPGGHGPRTRGLPATSEVRGVPARACLSLPSDRRPTAPVAAAAGSVRGLDPAGPRGRRAFPPRRAVRDARTPGPAHRVRSRAGGGGRLGARRRRRGRGRTSGAGRPPERPRAPRVVTGCGLASIGRRRS